MEFISHLIGKAKASVRWIKGLSMYDCYKGGKTPTLDFDFPKLFFYFCYYDLTDFNTVDS